MKKLILLGVFEILLFVCMSFKLGESADKPKEISIDEFPLTVGSQWTYLKTNTLTRFIRRDSSTTAVETETVTVQIAKTVKKKKKGIISEWVRRFNTEVDTQFVIFKKDTLEFTTSENATGSPFNFKIAFPIKFGNRWYGWYGEPPRDSFKVVHEESLKVAAEKFSQVYLIERGTFIPNSLGYYKCWIVPEIGIVKMSRWSQNTLGGEYEVENWDLIGYDIRK